jgi:hypothetical protein
MRTRWGNEHVPEITLPPVDHSDLVLQLETADNKVTFRNTQLAVVQVFEFVYQLTHEWRVSWRTAYERIEILRYSGLAWK